MISELTSALAAICEEQFSMIGWAKPEAYFHINLAEQDAGKQVFLVAHEGQSYCGHVKLVWESHYQSFKEQGIPEIVDLNVLPSYRKRGIGTALIESCERLAADRSTVLGIGVGLHPGYNNAQRLYAKLGYLLDGQGVHYQDKPVLMGQSYVFDDDLTIYFTKLLSPKLLSPKLLSPKRLDSLG